MACHRGFSSGAVFLKLKTETGYFSGALKARRQGGAAVLFKLVLLMVLPFVAGPLMAGLSVAHAQLPSDDPFASLLTRRAPSAVQLSTGEPQLFETTEGDETFLFQAQGNTALIRYLCDDNHSHTLECSLLDGERGEEVHLLTAKRSPRGDVTYKDSEGVTVLRVTANGGATLFQPDHKTLSPHYDRFSNGKAVLPVVGVSVSLQAPPASRALVEERMRRASELLQQRYGFFIPFVAPGRSNHDNAVLADTVLTTAKALDVVASDRLGAKVLRERLDMVEIVKGPQAKVALQGRTLLIAYDPHGSVEGRPSSLMIARFLETHL